MGKELLSAWGAPLERAARAQVLRSQLRGATTWMGATRAAAGDRSRAARALGLSRQGLLKTLARLGLDRMQASAA